MARKKQKKKLLWCGDAVRQTGFSRATHNICDRILDDWDITVLAINYFGDPHDYPYKIYPAGAGGDVFGFGRYPELCEAVGPDLVFILNDPWNIARFLDINSEKGCTTAPHMGYPPVDALNMREDYAAWLNDLHTCFFATEFGLQQAREAGFTGRAKVIPYGVDLTNYRPMDKGEAIRKLRENKLTIRYAYKDKEAQLPPYGPDSFIVGNVNRNQPRKRMDLCIMWFAEWIKRHDIKDAFLYFHCSPQEGWCDLVQMAFRYGILDRMILPYFPGGKWHTEEQMNWVYNMFDVQVTTTVGEGWGLPHIEGMACEVPQIVPDFAALGEWARGGVKYVPIAMYGVATPGNINTVSSLPDKSKWIAALHELYLGKKLRERIGKAGAEIARRDAYKWDNVAEQFNCEFHEAVAGKRAA